MATVPGPSRILRPELPKANKPDGTAGKAETSYHRSGVGFGTVPLAMRFGRLASPRFRFTLLTCGVNGAPVRATPLPANCQPRTKEFCFHGATQEKAVVKEWPMSKSDRPRSPWRL